MKIPHYLIQDEYLQVPIMRRFLQEHSIKGKNDLSEMRIAIEEFADQSDANKQAVYEWLEEVVREGSKELCYKKLYDIEDYYFQPQYARTLLNNAYPDCPNVELMQYRSTGTKTLINYKIIESDDGKVERIDFAFAQLLLREDTKASTQQQKIGSPIVYPTFVRLYMKEVLHLVFKRNNTKYFPVANQLTVQFGAKNDFGYIKIMQFAEEADINNVLQTVFNNYGGL